jgi:hypothetical protein
VSVILKQAAQCWCLLLHKEPFSELVVWFSVHALCKCCFSLDIISIACAEIALHPSSCMLAGRMLVLQPDTWHWFSSPEPAHPMLPSGPDMWLLGVPQTNKPTVVPTVSAPGTADEVNGSQPSNGAKASAQQNCNGKAPQASTTALAVQSRDLPVVASNGKQVALRTTADAVNALMDAPHPLDILADPGAYMDKVGMKGSAAEEAQAWSWISCVGGGLAGGDGSGGTGGAPAHHCASLDPVATHLIRCRMWCCYSLSACSPTQLVQPYLPTVLTMCITHSSPVTPQGSISRYHNPENYTAALGRIIYLKRMQVSLRGKPMQSVTLELEINNVAMAGCQPPANSGRSQSTHAPDRQWPVSRRLLCGCLTQC